MKNTMKGIAKNISVVIPVYNKEKYIDRCILSVLNQTLRPGEIVVIDDGSTDNSLEILKNKYADQIKLETQNNSGEAITRNNAVALTNGDFVAFLDGDDEWCPTFIESICNLMSDYPECNLYATAYKLVSDNKEVIPRYQNLKPNFRGIVSNYFSASLNGWSIFSSSSTVVSIELFYEVGQFTPNLRLGADLDLWSRLALEGSIAFLNEPHAIYHYFNDSSVTNTEISHEELYYTKHLTHLLKTNQVPKKLRTSVKKFVGKGLQNLVLEQAKQGQYKLLRNYIRDIRFYRYFGFSTFKMLFAIAFPKRVYLYIKQIKSN